MRAIARSNDAKMIRRRLIPTRAPALTASRHAARLYGRRTSGVRVLWVVTGFAALHTRRMPGNTGITAFVTGAAGLVGTELVKVLVARGHRVLGLTPSFEGAEDMRRAGAIPVIGDLLEAGRWQ